MKVTALAGGVGGAKLVNGLSKILPPGCLSVIVNTGDDFFYSGLFISPDIDTVTYTLAGINNQRTGWGRRDETWNTLMEIQKRNNNTWFQLGDKDLANHLERTRLLSEGYDLTAVTIKQSEKFNIQTKILPMSNDPVRTLVNTRELGVLPFQEYFVKHSFKPSLISLRFEGIEKASISREVFAELFASDLIVICPSNPLVSIYPIIGINGIQELIHKKRAIAVSPIIGGRSVKGPAAKMFLELGIQPTSSAVADFYKGLIDGFVFDSLDWPDAIDSSKLMQWGIIPLVTDTIMVDNDAQVKLAKEVLNFANKIIQ